METVLTITDVAKKLQLSATTVYKYAEDGKIPSMKIGKQWRFTENDVENYLQSCKNQKNIKGAKK
ncbi:MAG: helix-turn-helix domain-containing protein [Treponema sp.]|jgi:PTS system nitrogen regulatory IIA component|nr:helix-turn-helix domain-containing protein [Treponema sp.]